jgi:broad specificity phosphatase PhoE
VCRLGGAARGAHVTAAGSALPRIIAVRHGETEWSKLGKHTSYTDLSLTPEGGRAAVAIGPRLKTFAVAKVLVSPRRRARETAELAGFGAAEICEDLAEWNYGEDEGLTTSEIRKERPGWTVWKQGPRAGETAEQVSARCERVIAQVLAAPGDVIVFAHGHILDALAARWIGLPVACGGRFYLDPATVSVLGWHHEDRVIRQWNTSLFT